MKSANKGQHEHVTIKQTVTSDEQQVTSVAVAVTAAAVAAVDDNSKEKNIHAVGSLDSIKCRNYVNV